MSSSTWTQALQAAAHALAPLPKYPFGPGNDDDSRAAEQETGVLQDVARLTPGDYRTLGDILKTAANTDGSNEEDDDQLLLERTVTLLAKLPPHSREGRQLTEGSQ